MAGTPARELVWRLGVSHCQASSAAPPYDTPSKMELKKHMPEMFVLQMALASAWFQSFASAVEIFRSTLSDLFSVVGRLETRN